MKILDKMKLEIRQLNQSEKVAGSKREPYAIALGNLLLTATGSFERGYHLEFAVDNLEKAHEICNKLAESDIFANISNISSELFRVYLKDSESICNMMALAGAHKSMCELNNQIALRSVRNVSNRRANCDAHNIEKQIAVASAQVQKISALMETDEFADLPNELQHTARVRLENPDATYDELAKILGISKSGLLHRLKRIIQ